MGAFAMFSIYLVTAKHTGPKSRMDDEKMSLADFNAGNR